MAKQLEDQEERLALTYLTGWLTVPLAQAWMRGPQQCRDGIVALFALTGETEANAVRLMFGGSDPNEWEADH